VCVRARVELYPVSLLCIYISIWSVLSCYSDQWLNIEPSSSGGAATYSAHIKGSSQASSLYFASLFLLVDDDDDDDDNDDNKRLTDANC